MLSFVENIYLAVHSAIRVRVSGAAQVSKRAPPCKVLFFACFNSRQAKLPLFRQRASVSSVQSNGCKHEDYKIQTHTSCLCHTSADPWAPYNCCKNKLPSRQFVSKSSNKGNFPQHLLHFFFICCLINTNCSLFKYRRF